MASKIVSIAAVTSLAFGSLAGMNPSQVLADNHENTHPKIKNVIFLIGDGMGPSYTTAYRYLKDDPSTTVMEPTGFDPYLVGMQKTYSDDPEENITDSAAAATSMSSGVKTYNGAVAVDNDRSPVKTVLEQAKENGKSTGLVATSQLTHATPASYGAHNEARGNEYQIAEDYYDLMTNGEHQIDVMLGGGTEFFKQDDRNLVEEFQQDGYSYVTSRDELMSNNDEQVLGLFAPEALPKMKDRTDDIPSLAEMTNSAIDRLSKDKDGFFLMVEGSQIDWAGHGNDIVGAMSEMEDYEKAFNAAVEFAKKDKHTLVVATADHSTGGLSIGRGGPYKFNADVIKKVNRTPEFMAEKIANGADAREVLEKYTELDITDEEVAMAEEAVAKLDENKYALSDAIAEIFNIRARAGWTTGGHTGVDVQVYAYGPGKEMFAGLTDNTDQAKSIFKILGDGKEKKEIKFSDLGPNSTGIVEVKFLVNKGIINGYKDGTFKPTQTITEHQGELLLERATEKDVTVDGNGMLKFDEMASLMVEALELGTAASFEENVNMLKDAGVFFRAKDYTGMENKNVSRVEFSMFLYNALN